MPEEAVCPTCRCTVVVTQQGTCPLGHPIDSAAVKAAQQTAPAPAPQAAAPVAAAGAATAGAVVAGAGAVTAPQQAPPTEDPFAAPGTQQPQAGGAPTADTSTLPPPGESDFLSGPAPEPAAQKPKHRTSPVFVVLLVLILVLVVVAAVMVVFFPEMIGLAMAVPVLAVAT